MSHNRRHNPRVSPSQPLWLRWVAALCVAVAGLVGSAQAVHIHGQWLPQNAHTASHSALPSDGTGEEHCPLCVALHSALPVTPQLSAEPVLATAAVVTIPDGHDQAAVPHFALFSRPPPLKL